MSRDEPPTEEHVTDSSHHDIDEDDHHPNAQHKIIPTRFEQTETESKHGADSSVAKPHHSDSTDFDVTKLIQNDLKTYINTPVPKDYQGFIPCRIRRTKEGFTRGWSMIFEMFYKDPKENNSTLCLTAKRNMRFGGYLEYYIGTEFQNPSKHLTDEHSLANLRGETIVGSEYIFHDHQEASYTDQQGLQLAAIVYREHTIGASDPRQVTVLFYDTKAESRPEKVNEKIIEEWRSGNAPNLIEMKNKMPKFNEETKEYTLDVTDHRITVPSHKNFQLIQSSKDGENTVLQFGRIDEENFALSYRHPLTAMQAFAIALSTFHSRFRT